MQSAVVSRGGAASRTATAGFAEHELGDAEGNLVEGLHRRAERGAVAAPGAGDELVLGRWTVLHARFTPSGAARFPRYRFLSERRRSR